MFFFLVQFFVPLVFVSVCCDIAVQHFLLFISAMSIKFHVHLDALNLRDSFCVFRILLLLWHRLWKVFEQGSGVPGRSWNFIRR